MSSEELGFFEFWSPSEIMARVRNVYAGWQTLAADMQGANIPDAQRKAFNLTYAAFKEWKEGITWLGTWSASTLTLCDQYAKQLSYWRQQYTSLTGARPTGASVELPSVGASLNETLGKVAQIAGLGLGAYLAYKLLHNKRW